MNEIRHIDIIETTIDSLTSVVANFADHLNAGVKILYIFSIKSIDKYKRNSPINIAIAAGVSAKYRSDWNPIIPKTTYQPVFKKPSIVAFSTSCLVKFDIVFSDLSIRQVC